MSSDPLAVAALWVSIVAAVIALGAAVYTKRQADAANRSLRLEHEPLLNLAIERSPSISIPVGRLDGTGADAPRVRTTGGGMVLNIRNEGRGIARDVHIEIQSGRSIALTKVLPELRPSHAESLQAAATMPAGDLKARLTWRTLDGQRRRANRTIVARTS